MSDPDISHLRAADSEALRQWAWKVYKRGRKPEGVFDGDTGKFIPSEREAKCVSRDGAWVVDLSPRAPRSFQSWHHVYHLCVRARAGRPVPADITQAFEADFGKIAEKHLNAAVTERLRAESEAHAKAQRRQRELEKAVEAQSADARLAERQKQLVRIDALIKKRESQIKALQTRRSRVTRSITMLEKSAVKIKGETS